MGRSRIASAVRSCSARRWESFVLAASGEIELHEHKPMQIKSDGTNGRDFIFQVQGYGRMGVSKHEADGALLWPFVRLLGRECGGSEKYMDPSPATQLALIEPHLDARRAQRVANLTRRFRVLRPAGKQTTLFPAALISSSPAPAPFAPAPPARPGIPPCSPASP